MSFRDNPKEVKISDFGFHLGEYFTYEYNFFSNWVHILRIEKILERNEKRFYPFCIDSKRIPPSEECRESSGLYYVVNEVLEKLGEMNEGDMDFYRPVLNERLDRPISSRKNINTRLMKQDHHELENSDSAEGVDKSISEQLLSHTNSTQ
jgi:pRiA4b ORF-3-like protein